MPEVHVSRDDIAKLKSRLTQIEPDLSEGERALLAAILEMAANTIRRPDEERKPVISEVSAQPAPVVVASHPALPSLSEQFDRAFTAGALPAGKVTNINIVGSPVD